MKIKDLLKTKQDWTQGTLARDKDGNAHFSETNSTSWCLGGAIERCYPNRKIRNKVHLDVVGIIKMEIADWNDDPKRTFADVRKLIEEMDI